MRQQRHRVDGAVEWRAVTQQEAEEEEEEAVCHTGSFMREEARDSQPAPAPLLFSSISLYCTPGSPSKGLR